VSSTTPGTVSKILWHFTGGPKRLENGFQSEELRDPEIAYKALSAIVTSQRLKMGSVKERFITNVETLADAHQRVFSRKMGSLLADSMRVDAKEYPFELKSAVCVADIPIQHLTYHAERYGQFAIGFHREVLVKHRFNPVLYTLPSSPIAECITNAMREVTTFQASLNNGYIEQKDPFEGMPEDFIGRKFPSDIEVIGSHLDALQEQLSSLMLYFKGFSNQEFETIYCEREWRSERDFIFALEDVPMIILPKEGDYFARFLQEHPGLPRTIPVIPWEDLIEH